MCVLFWKPSVYSFNVSMCDKPDTVWLTEMVAFYIVNRPSAFYHLTLVQCHLSMWSGLRTSHSKHNQVLETWGYQLLHPCPLVVRLQAWVEIFEHIRGRRLNYTKKVVAPLKCKKISTLCDPPVSTTVWPGENLSLYKAVTIHSLHELNPPRANLFNYKI